MIVVMVTGCSLHLVDMLDELKHNDFGFDIRIVGVNCDENALPYSLIDARYIAPRVTDPKYIDCIVDICQKEEVDVILPFVTSELVLMAEKRQEIESRCNAKVSISSVESMKVATNKIETFRLFHEFMPVEIDVRYASDIKSFFERHSKVCCKLPDRSGGLGFAIVDESKALDPMLLNKYATNRYIRYDDLVAMFNAHPNRGMILQEFIEGDEFSLCCLADNGDVRFEIGYDVPVISYGAPMVARIDMNENASKIAKQVIAELKFDGNINFDFIIRPDGRAVLLDINPRINANIGFVAKAGMNLPLYRVVQLAGIMRDKEEWFSMIRGKLEEKPVDMNLCMQKILRNDYHSAKS